MEINITPVEKSDFVKIKDLLASDASHVIVDVIDFSKRDVEKWFQASCGSEHIYAVRTSKEVYKNFLVGCCGFRRIDWVARHAEIWTILFPDLDNIWSAGPHEIKTVMRKQLDIGFYELNMNKMWLKISHDVEKVKIFEELGFMAEGISRSAKFYEGAFVDEIVFSLLVSEHKHE